MEKQPKVKADRLVILDYITGLIHNYNIEPGFFIDAKYIRTLGYDPEKVVYMFGNLQNREHKGILTRNIR